jgi:predicted transcriptional regulator
MARPPKPGLSDLENRVMNIVWDHNEVTAEAVRTQIEATQAIKDSTVRTILRRLEAKGFVRHRVDGRTFIYSPTVASNNAAADAVRSIMDRFCNGSIESLLVGLVNREVVSPEKLQELGKRIAEERQKTEGRESTKPTHRKGN